MQRKRPQNRSQPVLMCVGLHACREVLKNRPKAVKEVWVQEGINNKDVDYFVDWGKKHKVMVKSVAEKRLLQLSSVHQGVALSLSEPLQGDLKDIERFNDEEPICLLALDEIKDPHNLGAIMRTAWLMGVKGLIVPEKRAAHLTPTVMKVASGGAEHVPLWVVGNLSQSLNYIKSKGFWVFGLAAEGTKALWEGDLPERIVWVVGSEQKGLRESVRKACDELVGIPQVDAEASYNASVATALALAETRRQRENL